MFKSPNLRFMAVSERSGLTSSAQEKKPVSIMKHVDAALVWSIYQFDVKLSALSAFKALRLLNPYVRHLETTQ